MYVTPRLLRNEAAVPLAEGPRLSFFKQTQGGPPSDCPADDIVANSYGTILVLSHLDLAQQIEAQLARVLSRHHLTVLQFKLAVVLHTRGTSSVAASELARRAGVSKTAVTFSVDQMVRKKLVARQRDPADRRFIRIQLTEEGALNIRTALDAYLRAVASFAAHLDLPTIHAALGTLSRLQRSLTVSAKHPDPL